ncbi:MAG: CHAD domain-containing protein [Tetrasphaera sp.]|nr:CHAD domain-containing protein [Tetrasphaera sp.]
MVTPSALHQTRVGLRRFRSALSLFRRALDDPQVEWLGDEVRELALPLGDARDLDVLMAEPGWSTAWTPALCPG